MTRTAPTTVKVQLPDLTAKLLNAVKAVVALPEEWNPEATVTVSEICGAIAGALLPDGEHNEEVCSTALVACPECGAEGDRP